MTIITREEIEKVKLRASLEGDDDLIKVVDYINELHKRERKYLLRLKRNKEIYKSDVEKTEKKCKKAFHKGQSYMRSKIASELNLDKANDVYVDYDIPISGVYLK